MRVDGDRTAPLGRKVARAAAPEVVAAPADSVVAASSEAGPSMATAAEAEPAMAEPVVVDALASSPEQA
eukprot:scaffold25100_cov68-Phaeocystis_antarctica.AAC.8